MNPPVTNPERRFNVWRWMILGLAVAVAGMLMVGSVFYASYRRDQSDQRVQQETQAAALTAERLCRAIVQFAAGSNPANLKPGDYGYSYARDHPDEVRAYEQRDPVEIAKALGCPQTEEMP